MSFREALELLYRRGNEVLEIHPGLRRIRVLMEALGNPHLKFPALHIAGTNGKGSVAAMAESMLRTAGWRTGLFTSPHLERIQERIRINGSEISSRPFASLISRISSLEDTLLANARLDARLTFFELVTAAAFLYFAEQEVDIGVIEVGLGGRWDATNIVRPRTCVITGISYDHTDILGGTLAEIAREKAGIIKAGVPVVSGSRRARARAVIRKEARRMGSRLIEIDRECDVQVTGDRRGRFTIDLRTPSHLYRKLRLSLAGRHQARNAALAVTAVELLDPLSVSESAVRRGLAAALWPGRLDAFHAQRRTLLDGAHNPEAAQLLREHLEWRRISEVHLVFGAMRDKDLRSIGNILFPIARSIHLTPVSTPRSADPHAIASLHERFRPHMRIHDGPREALRSAWNECSGRGWVLVTGSLYLVGELLPVVRHAGPATPG